MSTQPQVSQEHYDAYSYDTRERWISYWHQIADVLSVRPRTCLNIGVGSGVVSGYLRMRGVRVTDLDIDAALKPDVLGSVTHLPFVEDAFDVVLCAQVLEHTPAATLGASLREIGRIARTCAVVSVPHRGRHWVLSLKLPAMRKLHLQGHLLALRPFKFDGQHYWEMGAPGTRSGWFVRSLENHFAIVRSYSVIGNPYHSFFVLEPKNSG